MKKVSLLFLMMFLLAIIPSVYATTECFQEFANQSTVCGGLDGGWYTFFGSYSGGSPMSNLYDGDYDTTWMCDSCSDGTDYWEIVYEKPAGATNNSLWQIKDWDFQLLSNFSIPSGCWDYNSTYLLLTAFSSGSSEYNVYKCYDGSSYQLVASGGSGMQIIFEEGMYWFIEEIPTPSPSEPNFQFFIDLNSSLGTGFGLFMTNILYGLVAFMLVIAILYFIYSLFAGIVIAIKVNFHHKK